MSAPVLSTRGLDKSFGSLVVAHDIEIALPQGVRYALIGPNGAGKTTLINLMTGMLRPDAGQILLGDEDITALDPEQRVRRGLVRTFQINSLFPHLNPLEAVTLAVCERERIARTWWRTDRRLSRRGRRGLRHPQLARCSAPVCYRETRELAYGQQRLLEIALALATKPKVLLLDEPAAGVPRDESAELFTAITSLSQDITVLFIEHDMDLVFRLASRIIVMVGGASCSKARRRKSRPIRACARSISAERIMAEPLLAFKNVRAGYGDAVVLDDISFELAEHGSLAVLGRNGVGKSTLLLTIMGFTRVGRGSIVWRGADITRAGAAPPRARRHRLGGAGARDFRQPHGRGESDRRRPPRPLGPRRGLRPVPAHPRAPRRQGQPALRRRAADAGDRARADDQPGAAAARRAARGPRPDHRRGTGARRCAA